MVPALRNIMIGVLLVLTASCAKNKKAEYFSMLQVYDFEIRAGLNTTVTHFFVSPPLNSTYELQLEETGHTADQVGGVFPKFAELSAVFDDVDLDFVSAVEIRLYDPFDPDHAQEVFYMIPVPANTNATIRPFPGLANVEDIVSEPTYGIEMRLIFRQPPPITFDLRLELELSVQEK